MSEERKKLLWISVSACVFGLVLIGAGFFLFAPRSGGAAAPATIGNIAAPKALYPQDYLSAPLPLPLEDMTTTTIGPDGTSYVVYGDPLPPVGESLTAPAPDRTTPDKTGAAPAGASVASKAPAAKTPAASPPAAKKAPALAKVQSPAKAVPAVKADYWIQAASFTSRGRADDLKQALSEKGIATHLSVKDIVGKSWYRVRVGPYATKAEAEGWLGRLKALPQCSEAYVSKGN